MSPAVLLRRCDDTINNCVIINPSTYAWVIAIVAVFLFASLLAMRRRRRRRLLALRARGTPFVVLTPTVVVTPGPPPTQFEPAPPYEAAKEGPIQYPPPTYSPG